MDDTIQITLKLFATLTRRASREVKSGQSVALTLPATSHVIDALQALDVPPDEVHVVFVNGVRRGLDTCLESGDAVGVFPLIGGG